MKFHFPEYDYVVVNKNLDFCVSQIQNIIIAERLKRSRHLNLTEFVNSLECFLKYITVDLNLNFLLFYLNYI